MPGPSGQAFEIPTHGSSNGQSPSVWASGEPLAPISESQLAATQRSMAGFCTGQFALAMRAREPRAPPWEVMQTPMVERVQHHPGFALRASAVILDRDRVIVHETDP